MFFVLFFLFLTLLFYYCFINELFFVTPLLHIFQIPPRFLYLLASPSRERRNLCVHVRVRVPTVVPWNVVCSEAAR